MQIYHLEAIHKQEMVHSSPELAKCLHERPCPAMERGGRSFGGERAREMAIGAGGDVSADNSSVARRRPVLRVAIRPCAELAFLLRPPLFPPPFLG